MDSAVSFASAIARVRRISWARWGLWSIWSFCGTPGIYKMRWTNCAGLLPGRRGSGVLRPPRPVDLHNGREQPVRKLIRDLAEQPVQHIVGRHSIQSLIRRRELVQRYQSSSGDETDWCQQWYQRRASG